MSVTVFAPAKSRFIPAMLVAAALFTASVGFCQSKERSRPNVLFFAIDDLNDWVGCMDGHPDALTPNIDRVAAKGTVFMNAACAAPACVPSRSALITGISPATSGLYTNIDASFKKYDDLKNLVTLPEYFAKHGYVTMGTGKVTHSPLNAGFQINSGIRYHVNPRPKGYNPKLKPNQLVNGVNQDWLPLDVPREEMTDWKSAEWTVAQLKKKHDKPFFLGCGVFRPHDPWNVPRKYYDKFPLDSLSLSKIKADDLDDVPEHQRRISRLARECLNNEKFHRTAVQAYLASINFADDCLGLVLDALEQSPYSDNTIIMLWSDHGYHVGEKLSWSKFRLWEESAHCVLICSAPSVTKPGTRCMQPVNLLDMYPSLLELCALPKSDVLEGTSFVPQLRDPTARRERPTITANQFGFSLRTERWRYIWYRTGEEELYDHAQDPYEWSNQARNPEQSEIISRLKPHVPKKFSDVRVTPEMQRKLKAKTK